ncbi:3'(2'),5'-bisphosphate nucleotidase CysQ [[Pseudomonas] carboxydohydrogena]|uniref:3'(2'),5'-bisphosphate nucleotidase CysQ n=1 Tax=Afipia carboxydohydrogena TaxID=290 RepID=A0ABY8BMR5_AFICR|nr:3'(2'),5'-bisphosphate nucleotidase CysQ [[Pseudomonas] carboxydohydrogena]WEF51213.1 3'(2'),5'-bisphosphate nucleotidase CysQ [[Pseudomonas] carboxydohydrogena]
MPGADDQLAAEAALLAGSLREAGRLAAAMFGTDVKSWIKGGSSPVSDADIAVNHFLEERLRSFNPDYGWLSEESADDLARLDKPRVWVVDPIDGTRAFLNKRKDWSISVALVEHGVPVLGCVYAPMSDEFYLAERGKGATLNASAINAARGTDLDLTRIAAPQSILDRVAKISGGTAGYPRIGSLALRMCRVANGALDAAFAGGHSRDWDIAAADLIISEAGGAMTELTGENLRYNGPEVAHGILMAAGQSRHRHLLEALSHKPVFNANAPI